MTIASQKRTTKNLRQAIDRLLKGNLDSPRNPQKRAVQRKRLKRIATKLRTGRAVPSAD